MLVQLHQLEQQESPQFESLGLGKHGANNLNEKHLNK